jgi:asparagine synthase (glutamine-hydrolysing)
MCSILGILTSDDDDARSLRTRALELSRRQRHRGPDWSGVWASERALLVHERLAIVDVEHGAQPLVSPDGRRVLAVNGEIYNHQELREGFDDDEFLTLSDCEVILPLWRRDGADMVGRLNGIFAFVAWDENDGYALIARDPIGVMPLYTGRDAEGRLYVASEMKALIGVCDSIEIFPPGHLWDTREPKPRRYWSPPWRDYSAVQGTASDAGVLRKSLEAAVERQLMCDVPYGVLLSGGLDSSVLSAICHRFYRHRVETGGKTEAWWPQLHSFAIGLEGAPDLAAARKAADAIGTIHHEFRYTVDEGLDALRDVIWHIESCDVTTVRASTPMVLLARRIKAMGIKMVLSGEGADEIFGGYLYFHKAPNAREFHEELIRKLDDLHRFDCLRANKSLAAWGIEGRVPFLDREFLDVAMSFDAAHKMTGEGRIEKHVLRDAFRGYLPDEILWRQKEQFSDGVGYGWIDSLRTLAESRVGDADFAARESRFPIATPMTREGYFYRQIFEEHFPGDAAARTLPVGPSIACSTPTAIRWDTTFAGSADPSGRAVGGIHQDAYDKKR